MSRPDPAASVALIPASIALTAAVFQAWPVTAGFTFIAACMLALFWNVAHQPDDFEDLIDATREPRIDVPDYVPAEWIKEAGR